MALSAVSRYEFIADAMHWIATYNLDGIDIDWEYPVGPPWGGLPIVTRAEDAETYITLLTELRRAWSGGVAKAAYLYDGDLFITYEDEQSLGHKVDYIREKGLGGIMIWEYGHDLDSDLLEALNDHIRRTE